jgi:serine/threonine protein kinase/outer membrane protein assembly factor BamB/tetratricopeptide (TPR) repeat protein
MTLSGFEGTVVRAAVQNGWINQFQAQDAYQKCMLARQRGQSIGIGQVFIRLGLLSEEQSLDLLEACGLKAVHCARCQQAWNIPQSALASGATFTCPNDGQDLALLRTLNVVGRYPQPGGSGRLARASSHPMPVLAIESSSSISSSFPAHRSSSIHGHGWARLFEGDEELAQRYKISEEIARGGMGAIYLAYDSFLERPVAMKVMLNGSSAEAEQRFLLEARITSQLDHPNIVPVHDIGRLPDGTHYFTMKLVRGRSLQKIIENHAQGKENITLRRYLGIFSKVLEAVNFAHHAHDVIHRDLKPENVMIGEFGEVLVMDWGISKRIGKVDDQGHTTRVDDSPSRVQENPNLTRQGVICGTLNYMPPEQADGDIEKLDGRSDVYALGCILYEILTLKQAFTDANTQALLAKIFSNLYDDPQLIARERNIPPELAAVVTKALQSLQARRYANVGALQQDIEAFLEGRAVSARRDPLFTRISKWGRRHSTLVASFAIAFMALVAVMVLFFLLPAHVSLDLKDCPKNLSIWVDGAPIEIGKDQKVVELTLWPPGDRLIRIESPLFQSFEKRLELSSRALQKLSIALVRQTGKVTVNSDIGTVTVEFVPLQGTAWTLQGPFYERPIATGRYVVNITCLDHFTKTQKLEVKADQTIELEADLESCVLWERQTQLPIIDRRLADVDEDGLFDILMATRNAIEVQDLATKRVRWRSKVSAREDRPFIRGRFLELADYDGDGRLEVAFQNGTFVRIVDATTGDEENRFARFFCRLKSIDVEKDGSSEILCATPYSGVQVFRADGSRIWAIRTPRYSHNADILVLPFGDKQRGILVQSQNPPKLFFLDMSDGHVLWSRPKSALVTQNGTVSCIDEAGQSFIVTRSINGVVAFSALDGHELWSRSKTLGSPRWLKSGSFNSHGRVSILCHGDKGISCLNSQGRVVWSSKRKPLGPGSFGDLDGDGDYEWFVYTEAAQKQGMALSVFNRKGQIVRELLLSNILRNGRVIDLPPIVADVYGDGRPCVLVTGEHTMKLLKLQAESRLAVYPKAGISHHVIDLNDDGKTELIRYTNQFVSSEGSVNWTAPTSFAAKGARFRSLVAIKKPRFADINSDGFKDVLVQHSSWLLVLSGRDGSLLVKRKGPTLSRGPYQCSRSLGSRSLVYATASEIKRIEYDPKNLEGRDIWSDAWNRSEGEFVIVNEPLAGLLYIDSTKRLVLRDLERGKVIWTREMSQAVGRGGALATKSKIYVPGALGTVFVFDFSGKKLLEKRLSSAIRTLFFRTGLSGQELVAVGWEPGFDLLDPVTLALRKRISSPGINQLGRWTVVAKDVDKDGVDDFIISMLSGYLRVLNGRDFLPIFSSQRFKKNVFFSEVFQNIQLADSDRDGKVDFLINGGHSVILEGFEEHIRLAQKTPRSPDPLIEFAYFLRDLQSQSAARISKRLSRLKGTRLQQRAESLASSVNQKSSAKFASKTRSGHLARLIAAVRAGQSLQSLSAGTRLLLKNSLDSLLPQIQMNSLSDHEKSAIISHISAVFRNDSAPLNLIVQRAERRQHIGDEKGYRDLLGSAVLLFPWDEKLAKRFEEAVSQFAVARHLTFDRVHSIEAVEAALKIRQSRAFHLLLARLIRARIKNEGQRVLFHHSEALKLSKTKAERAEALAHRALFYASYRKGPEVNRDLNEALSLAPRNALVCAVAGILSEGAKDPSQPAALLDWALSSNFKDALGLGGLVCRTRARLHLRSGDVDSCFRLLKEALRRSGSYPGSVEELFSIAQQMCLKGALTRGLALMRSVVTLISEKERPKAVFVLRRFEIVHKARTIPKPQSRSDYFIHGCAALVSKQRQKGLEFFEKVLRGAQGLEKIEWHYRLADFEKDYGDVDQAMRYLGFIVKTNSISPWHVKAHLQLAKIVEKSNSRRAENELLKAIELGATADTITLFGLRALLLKQVISDALERGKGS